MLFWRPLLPLPSNHCFAIYQKSDFNRSKSHLNSFTFHEVFLLTQDHIFCSDSYRGSVKFYRDTTQIQTQFAERWRVQNSANRKEINLKWTSMAKSANSNLLLPTSPPPPSHFENILLVRNIEIKIKQMLSFIYQNSVPNFNCPLVHAIGCIENQIKLWYMQMS